MSLRTRLLLLVTSVVIPAVLTCALTGYLVYTNERGRAETNLLAVTRATAASVDRELHRLGSQLKILAASPPLVRGDLQEFYVHAKQGVQDDNLWILLTLPSGQQVINTLLPFGAELPRHGLPDNVRRIVKNRETIVTDLFRGAVTKRPVLAIEIPVIHNDRVLYVLSMGISPNYVDSLLRSYQLPRSWVAGITDRKGVLIARSREPERLVGGPVVPELLEEMMARDEGLIRTTTHEGIPALSAFSVGPTFGWRFAVGVPQAEIQNAIETTWLVVSTAGLFIIAVGLVISLAVARGIARSIASLVERATTLGRGSSFDAAPTGLTEVDAVATALGRAGALLTDRERSLHAAVDRAERAAQAQSRFFVAASHDLRQPFQAMRLYYEVLKQAARGDQTLVIDRLGQAMGSAEELLNDLLDVARLESGAITPRPVDVDLGRLVADLQEELGPVAVQKGLSLSIHQAAVVVRTDPVMLKRILFNIATNAIRYTVRGGLLIAIRRRVGRVCIEVWDTGIGIPDDQAECIFEEFYQGHNSARDRAQGIGLGLAIVKRLSTLLGYEVTFSSRLGKGTVFRVAIPSPGAAPSLSEGADVLDDTAEAKF